MSSRRASASATRDASGAAAARSACTRPPVVIAPWLEPSFVTLVPPSPHVSASSSASGVDDGHLQSQSRQQHHARSAPVHKLNAQQVAAVLQTFWPDVLQNNVKSVKKLLAAHHLAMDFASARHRPHADGTALHICAQHGSTALAQLLLDYGLDVDAQNKVGLTPLHVACKFQQVTAAAFLLDHGARVDIPDNQGHVAFDVAPFATLDQCVLQPWRDKLAVLELQHRELSLIDDAAQRDHCDARLAHERALIALTDCESHGVEEDARLRDARARDLHWSDAVHDAKATLAQQRAETLRLAHALEDEREALAVMWRSECERAQRAKALALEQLAQANALVDETERELEHRQRVLDDQCGLLAAAQAAPNDADVQHWVLSAICALADDATHERNLLDGLDVVRFLFHDDTARAVLDAMARFPTTRPLQTQALRCFVVLLQSARLMDTSAQEQQPRHLERFASVLLALNTVTAVREALVQCNEDIETFQLGFAVLHHVLSATGARTHASVLQFCQHRRAQRLPLVFMRLLLNSGAQLTVQSEDTAVPSLAASRHHSAFLLFVLVRYNAKRALMDADAVPIVLEQLELVLASAPERPWDADDSVAALQHLIASLANLHAVASPREQRTMCDASATLDKSQWTDVSVVDLVDRVYHFVTADAHSRASCDAMHWLLKLVRNLVWHNGAVAARIRTEVGEALSLVDIVAAALVPATPVSSSTSQQQQLGVVTGTELVDVVWISRFDTEGRLLATPTRVLALLADVLQATTERAGAAADESLLLALDSVATSLALAATNATNLRVLSDLESSLDASVQRIMAWIYDLHVSMARLEPSLCSLLCHVLRIYVSVFQHAHAASQAPRRQLHTRCRQLGLCAVLLEFREGDAMRDRSERDKRVNRDCANQSRASAEQLATLRALARTIANALSNDALVDNLARAGIVQSQRVVHAMKATDRAKFMAPHVEPEVAYQDAPQLIGYQQTISAPHMHAYALELADVAIKNVQHPRILDVGAGSGYLTACFGRLVEGVNGRVFGIERVPELVAFAKANVERAAKDLVEHRVVSVQSADGWDGLPSEAPFHFIHVGAAAVEPPQSLLDQLADGGRLVVPVGEPGMAQVLLEIQRTDATFTERKLMGVSYVPLVRERTEL